MYGKDANVRPLSTAMGGAFNCGDGRDDGRHDWEKDKGDGEDNDDNDYFA